ncbi:hypothetical protein [Roseateles sp.]|uniref:hypothetical protein n=1 Tax=Roseateles sp. TaxID=1971397 RepID=UPI0031DBF44C
MKFTQNYYAHSAVFFEIDKAGLQEFYRGFMANLPYSLDELFGKIWRTPGFSEWEASFREESLLQLADWLQISLEGVDSSNEVRKAPIPSHLCNQQPPLWDFTDASREIIVATGMYYGEVMVRQNPGVSWIHFLKGKSMADYGQPVIGGEVRRVINPVRVATSFAFGIMDGSESRNGLLSAYEFWKQKILKN